MYQQRNRMELSGKEEKEPIINFLKFFYRRFRVSLFLLLFAQKTRKKLISTETQQVKESRELPQHRKESFSN